MGNIKKAMDKKPKQIHSPFEIIAAMVMGLLAIGCFVIQISYDDQTTELETSLFNLLQFLLTVGFAWFTSKASSKQEFEENIRQFAFSAYRRILDLDRSLSRLVSRVNLIRSSYPDERIHELDIITAHTSSMGDTVRSSIADWSDVIGDEIKKQQKLQELEQQYSLARLIDIQQIDEDHEIDENPELTKLRTEIENLRSELPIMLNYEVKHISSYETPELIVKSLESTLQTQGELLLYAEAERSITIEDLQSFQPGTIMSLHPGRAMHSFNFIVYDNSINDPNSKWIGELVNPYDSIGVHYIEFNKALLDVIHIYAPMTETGIPDIDNIPVEFVGLSPHNVSVNFFL